MPRQNPLIKQQLTAWYLKRVPFPSVSYVTYVSEDPLVNGSVFAKELREHELYQIRHDLLDEGFPQGVRRWNWIWAKKNMGNSLGMGKTALMTYVCDQINKDFGESFFGHVANWLALYVPVEAGTKNIEDIAAFALASVCNQSRGISIEHRLLARLRHRVIVQNHNGQYPTNLAGIVWHRFVSDSWLAERGISRETLDADVERLLVKSHVSVQVAKALSRGELYNHLAALNGSPHLFPVNQSLHNKALGILLNDIACVAEAATIAKVTIFLDDFYFVVRALQPAEREPMAARIRKVAVDGSYESAKRGLFNWIAVMHTQTAHTFQSAWHTAGMDTHAPLMKWEDESSVVLRGFTVEQGGKLLREYLRSQFNRLTHAPNDMYPFSESALDAIALATRKKDASLNDQSIAPRGLMDIAYDIFTRALNEQAQAPIGPEFVAHAINGTPLLPASDDDEMENADTEESRPTIACPCGCHDDSTRDVFDVMTIIPGSGSARQVVRHYCQNCNEAIVIDGATR